jgi:hypothetical protein
MTFATIKSSVILECIASYHEIMTSKNKEELRLIIFNRMKDKKYWLFGRTLTSREAITRIEKEPYFFEYWNCKNNNYAYDYELRQIKRLANAVDTIQLSEEMSWILRYKDE